MENNFKVSQKPNALKQFFTSRKFWKSAIALIIGGIAGFMYYYFIGCKSGSCPITSNSYISIIWGGLLGLFMVNSPCSRGKC